MQRYYPMAFARYMNFDRCQHMLQNKAESRNETRRHEMATTARPRPRLNQDSKRRQDTNKRRQRLGKTSQDKAADVQKKDEETHLLLFLDSLTVHASWVWGALVLVLKIGGETPTNRSRTGLEDCVLGLGFKFAGTGTCSVVCCRTGVATGGLKATFDRRWRCCSCSCFCYEVQVEYNGRKQNMSDY
jgi:hypothetical protein